MFQGKTPQTPQGSERLALSAHPGCRSAGHAAPSAGLARGALGLSRFWAPEKSSATTSAEIESPKPLKSKNLKP